MQSLSRSDEKSCQVCPSLNLTSLDMFLEEGYNDSDFKNIKVPMEG
jgi:hypothetical protein